MRRLTHTLSNLVRGIPSVCLYSFEILLRKPRVLPHYLAEISRQRRRVLGQDLPSITPAKLLEYKGVYKLTFGEDGVDFNWLPDFLFLKTIAILKPKTAFEIGTYEGARTTLIASQAPEDVRIYTLDLAPDAEITAKMTEPHMIREARDKLGVIFRGTRWEKNITQLFGDSLTFDFSPYCHQMDFVYIDASHSYEYVLSDTRNAFTMVRSGGVIIWDDYGSLRAEYGTTRYLESLRNRGYPVWRLGSSQYAILRAREDIIKRYEIELPT